MLEVDAATWAQGVFGESKLGPKGGRSGWWKSPSRWSWTPEARGFNLRRCIVVSWLVRKMTP